MSSKTIYNYLFIVLVSLFVLMGCGSSESNPSITTQQEVEDDTSVVLRPSVDSTLDTTPPVITLNGNKTITIVQGTTFSDLGATAVDNIDEEITVIVSGTVESSTVGTYTLTYRATDSAGNSAVEIRTVNVTALIVVLLPSAPSVTPIPTAPPVVATSTSDTIKPVIRIIGSATETVIQGSIYADAGAIAHDNIDGNITSNIVTINPVDTTTVETYTVTYDVNDSSNNQAVQVTRTVNVILEQDMIKPVISLIGNAEINIIQGTTYIEQGATAVDNVDGEVTVVVSGTVDSATIGTYTITYRATDNAGNSAVKTRVLKVVATSITPPTNTDSGSSGGGGANPPPATVAKTKGEVIDSPVQGLNYLCDGVEALTNSSGEFECTNPPIVFKIGKLTLGSITSFTADKKVYPHDILGLARTNFTDARLILLAQLLQSLDDDGDISVLINILQGTRDLFTVEQNFSDLTLAEIEALLGKSLVNGIDAIRHLKQSMGMLDDDTTKPVISLVGNAIETVTQGLTYIDAGATAFDNIDGNITSNIITVNPVDISKVDTYIITYDINDTSNNQATQVIRTVNVKDSNTTMTTIEKLRKILEDDSIPYTTEADFNQSEYAKHHLPDEEARRLEKAHMLVYSYRP